MNDTFAQHLTHQRIRIITQMCERRPEFSSAPMQSTERAAEKTNRRRARSQCLLSCMLMIIKQCGTTTERTANRVRVSCSQSALSRHDIDKSMDARLSGVCLRARGSSRVHIRNIVATVSDHGNGFVFALHSKISATCGMLCRHRRYCMSQ